MDFYVLLGVERGATPGDIKRAYKRLARRYHPDINPGDRTAAQQFRQIAEAYETLSDPDRSAYQAYGLLQGTTAQILFDAPDPFLRCDFDAGMGLAASRHATDRALVDDPWQLPGEFVIGTDGKIRYVWVGANPNLLPPFDEIKATLNGSA